MAKDDCIFCKIAKKEIPSEIFFESDNFIAIKDLHPISGGHSLVISKAHFENVVDFPNILGGELLSAIKDVFFILKKETKCEGFNIVQNNFSAAGQVVNHIHFHIIPRKKNDGIKLN